MKLIPEPQTPEEWVATWRGLIKQGAVLVVLTLLIVAALRAPQYQDLQPLGFIMLALLFAVLGTSIQSYWEWQEIVRRRQEIEKETARQKQEIEKRRRAR
jgi:Na+/melibiose symporter-like transporter